MKTVKPPIKQEVPTKRVFVDRQYSQDTENKRRILRPIYKTAIIHRLYKGMCKWEGEYIKIQGRRYGINNLQNLPDDLNGFKCTSREDTDTIGFYGELNPMSNFFNCEVTVNKVRFHSSEQMIQFNKAKAFWRPCYYVPNTVCRYTTRMQTTL